MLNIFTTKTKHKRTQGNWEMLDVNYLDCGDMSRLFAYVQTHQIVLMKSCAFLCISLIPQSSS